MARSLLSISTLIMTTEKMPKPAAILYLKANLAYVREHYDVAFTYFQQAAEHNLKSAILWVAAMMIEGKGCERNFSGGIQLARQHMVTPLDFYFINRYVLLYHQEFDNKAAMLELLEQSTRHKDKEAMMWLAGLYYYGPAHFNVTPNHHRASWFWLLWKLSGLSLPYWVIAIKARLLLVLPFVKRFILKKLPQQIKEIEPNHPSREIEQHHQHLVKDAVYHLKHALEELGVSQEEVAAI